MKKILLCQHGGSGNHGCEALVRTTCDLIFSVFPDAQITLYSYQKGDDLKYLSDMPIKITGLSSLPSKYSLCNLTYHLKKKLGLFASKLPINSEFRSLVESSDAVIAIGGDNYCYNKGEGYYASDDFIRNHAKKYILFGCSIEPTDVPNGLGEHLKKTFDAITVRESISYNALRDFGIENAHLVHDPAFLLSSEKAPEKQNAVGINLSPLVLRSPNSDMILSNYVALIRYILDETDMDIKLVPHVVWKDNDDRLALELLKKAFGNEPRISLVSDANAKELKGQISSLRFFVGARTHATIAAYSTCVPTLVAGYSVKARGIARDLLETEDGNVVSVQKMTEPNELMNAFKEIYAKESEIKAQLTRIMPEYKQGSQKAAEIIQNII